MLGDDPLALETLRLGLARGGGLDRIGQAREIGLAVEDDGVGLFVVQEVLRENVVDSLAKLLVDLLEARLARFVEGGALAHELRIVDEHEALLLGRLRPEVALASKTVLDALIERRVLHHLVAERGEDRRHLLLDLLHVLVVEGRRPDAEQAADAREWPAGILERRDGVLEGRRRPVVDDRFDLGAVDIHPLEDRGLEAGDRHLVRRADSRCGRRSRDRASVRGKPKSRRSCLARSGS